MPSGLIKMPRSKIVPTVRPELIPFFVECFSRNEYADYSGRDMMFTLLLAVQRLQVSGPTRDAVFHVATYLF